MKLIDKDALVAEIEKLKGQLLRGACSSQISMQTRCKEEAYNEVLSFLDTIEAKEVDLEQEIHQHINDCLDIKFPTTNIKMIEKDVEYTARKFFELGLKAQKGE